MKKIQRKTLRFVQLQNQNIFQIPMILFHGLAIYRSISTANNLATLIHSKDWIIYLFKFIYRRYRAIAHVIGALCRD